MPIQISVCIVFHNEKARLPVCLRALLAQDTAHLAEIVMIDNASTDGSGQSIASFQAVSAMPIRVRRMSENNLGAARAEAVKLAQSSFIAFVDADIEVPESWLVSLARSVDEHMKLGSHVVGMGSGNRLSTNCAWSQAASILFSYVNLGSPQISPSGKAREVSHLSTCNVVLNREAVLNAGNFSSDFATVCEDVDLCCRLRNQGGRLVYVSGFEVTHHQTSDVLTWIERGYRYGWGNMKVVSRWPEYFSRKHLIVFASGGTVIGFAALDFSLFVRTSIFLLATGAGFWLLSRSVLQRFQVASAIALLSFVIPLSYIAGHFRGLLFLRPKVGGRA